MIKTSDVKEKRLGYGLVSYVYVIQLLLTFTGTHVFWTSGLPTGNFVESMNYWANEIGIAKSMVLGNILLAALAVIAMIELGVQGNKLKHSIVISAWSLLLMVYWIFILWM
jgi:hypothetical protein